MLGRANTLTWGGVTLAGIREKSFTLSGEPADETSGEDNGWRLYNATPAEKNCEFTIAGVVKSKTLLTDWQNQTVQKTVVYTRADGSVITGVFHMANYSQTDPYNGPSTFEATFQSSGAVTVTP